MAPTDNDSSTTSGDGPSHGGAQRAELAALVEKLISDGGQIARKDLYRLARLLRRYLRVGRTGVSLNGKGLADLLLAIAPRLPVRDRAALGKSYGGVAGGTLAGQVIKTASRRSAGIGGITGAFTTAGELAPPMWITLPMEIFAETLLVTAVEMRMIAELHEVYGFPIRGDADARGIAIVEAWSTRRGVDMRRLERRGSAELARDHGLGKNLTRVVKKKLMIRAAQNLGTLAPLFIGAAIGAETNRRSTRDIGNAIIHDLAKQVSSKSADLDAPEDKS